MRQLLSKYVYVQLKSASHLYLWLIVSAPSTFCTQINNCFVTTSLPGAALLGVFVWFFLSENRVSMILPSNCRAGSVWNDLSPLFRSFVSCLEPGLIFSKEGSGVSALPGDFSYFGCCQCSVRFQGGWSELGFTCCCYSGLPSEGDRWQCWSCFPYR